MPACGLTVVARDEGGYSHDGGTAAARRLLAAAERPDAIFCANDVMAMAALEVARVEFGLRVPEDLSIVGYDNAAPSGWPLHDLTTVDQDLDRMAALAIEMLLSTLESRISEPQHVEVPASIVARGTTRPLKT